MYIIGILMTIIGLITTAVGIGNRESAIDSYYGYGRYYNSGKIDDSNLVIIIGIVILVLGLLVILARYLKKEKPTTNKPLNLLNTKKCLKCGNIVNDGEKFCGRCGNDISSQSMNQQTRSNLPLE